jgi:hypothetical protein
MDGMVERVGDVTKYFPCKRMGDPAQLDSTLLYLVSPASECVTGTIVTVDDGQGRDKAGSSDRHVDVVACSPSARRPIYYTIVQFSW